MNESIRTLDRIRAGENVTVTGIDGGRQMRQRLNQMGVHVHDMISVRRNAILGGPVLIQVHGTEIAMGRGMARHISVVPSDSPVRLAAGTGGEDRDETV